METEIAIRLEAHNHKIELLKHQIKELEEESKVIQLPALGWRFSFTPI